MAGIRAVKPGATLGDVGHAIQTVAQRERFSIVREYCGHGIGKVYHDEPQVLHYGTPGQGLVLQPGMIFTIEPMLNAGKAATRELSDGWTVITNDKSLSAQWEHMVLVTETGPDPAVELQVARDVRARCDALLWISPRATDEALGPTLAEVINLISHRGLDLSGVKPYVSRAVPPICT